MSGYGLANFFAFENDQGSGTIEKEEEERTVFWKSRDLYQRRPTNDSDKSLRHPHRRKLSPKLKPKSPSDSDDSEQQVGDHEVTFPCSICQREIRMTSSLLHKKRHAALATLGLEWTGKKKPHSSVITNQRQFLVSRLLSLCTFSEKALQRINDAYELLQRRQMPVFYKILDNLDGTFTSSPQVCHLLIKGMATSGNRNSIWKVDTNDQFTIVNHFGNKPNVCFLGLFDGHQGDASAELASKELPVLCLHQLSRWDPSYQMTAEEQHLVDSFHTVFREDYISKEDIFSSTSYSDTQGREFEDIHKAFAKAYWRMDRLLRLGRNEVSRVQWSGCSAVTCILEGSLKPPPGTKTNSPEAHNMAQVISGVLHVANAGNVQAVLCRNGKSFCLTKEHTTRNITERNRVLQNGAKISPNEPIGFLEGYIKTTRGLGFHGNPKLKKFIIPVPQNISVPIDDLCQFLILATNGLWEVLDKQEVTALAITLFQTYKETYKPQEDVLSDRGSGTALQMQSTTNQVLFQYKPESKEGLSSTDLINNPDSERSEDHRFHDPKDTERTGYEPSREKGPDRPVREPAGQSFYKGVAEYVSRQLVVAALEAGSRDNIIVTVIFLSGTEYQLWTEN